MSARIELEASAELEAAAEKLGVSPQDFVESALAAALRSFELGQMSAEGLDLADPLLMRRRVAVDAAWKASDTWEQFEAALAARDLGFESVGAGLALISRSSGRRICRMSDVGPGRGALERRFGALDAPREAKTRASADEPLLARWRVLVAEALEPSEHWAAFASRLAERGLAMAPAGGGLELRDAATGERLAKASEVGPGYMALIRRFQAGFPGHSHAYLVGKALGHDAPAAKRARAERASEDGLIDYDDE